MVSYSIASLVDVSRTQVQKFIAGIVSHEYWLNCLNEIESRRFAFLRNETAPHEGERQNGLVGSGEILSSANLDRRRI
jgi:hypothetical protein